MTTQTIHSQPVFSATAKRQSPAFSAASQSAPAAAAATAEPSAPQTDSLALRDALLARQPKFSGIRPSIIEIAPDGRIISQDPTSKNFNEEKIITFNAPIYDITSLVFNRQMKYLTQKILDERREDGIDEDKVRDFPEAQAEDADPDNLDKSRFVPERDKITINLTSYGGDIFSLYSVYDIIERTKNNGIAVSVIGTGMVGEEALYLLAAGTPGYRGLTANTLVELNQPNGMGRRQPVSDLKKYYELGIETKDRLVDFLVQASSTGKTAEEIEKAMERARHMEAKEVIETWGWADFIADT